MEESSLFVYASSSQAKNSPIGKYKSFNICYPSFNRLMCSTTIVSYHLITPDLLTTVHFHFTHFSRSNSPVQPILLAFNAFKTMLEND